MNRGSQIPYDTGQQSAKVFSAKIFPAKLSCYTVFLYCPEEQAASLVGRGVVVSPDAVTTGYDAQVCVGQANYPGIVSTTGKFESSSCIWQNQGWIGVAKFPLNHLHLFAFLTQCAKLNGMQSTSNPEIINHVHVMAITQCFLSKN